MNKNGFSSKKILSDTWIIKSDGCTSYLITGNKEGAVIDTGLSEFNIQAYAQTLTDKEVNFCVNTNGYFRHTGGNAYFKKIYMSAEALKAVTIPYEKMNEQGYLLSRPITIVVEGTIIELAGRPLEIIEIPGHASGSIAILDKKKRILFTGDEVGRVSLVWIYGGGAYIEDYIRNMEKLMERKEEFDFILTGYGNKVYGKSLLQDSLENAKRILQGYMGKPVKFSETGEIQLKIPEPEYKRESVLGESCINFDSRFIKRDE